jgi:hypothetical protein
LSARDHRHRFKNGAHQAGLQENERGEMRRQKPEGRAERIVGKPEIIPVVCAKPQLQPFSVPAGASVIRRWRLCGDVYTIETGSRPRRQSKRRY